MMQETDGMNYSKRCRWQEMDINPNRFGQEHKDRVLSGFGGKPGTVTSVDVRSERCPSLPSIPPSQDFALAVPIPGILSHLQMSAHTSLPRGRFPDTPRAPRPQHVALSVMLRV